MDPKAPTTAPITPDLKAPEGSINADQATPVPPAPAPAKDERLEALERRERALQKQARDLKAQKAQMEQGSQGRLSAEEWKQKFMQDPTAVGLQYEEIANRYLKQPSPEEALVADLKRQIEELKGGQTDLQKKLADDQTKAYEAAKRQIQSDVEKLVGGNEEFSLVKASQASDAVTTLIERVYQDEGVLMSIEDAAREVESYLMEQAVSLASLEKVKKKILPPTPEAGKPEEGQKQTLTSTPRSTTLTHSMSQASTPPMDAKSRRARAIAAFQGQLK
jgi:uncharacterized phage infection (PIP) family protein YhgE